MNVLRSDKKIITMTFFSKKTISSLYFSYVLCGSLWCLLIEQIIIKDTGLSNFIPQDYYMKFKSNPPYHLCQFYNRVSKQTSQNGMLNFKFFSTTTRFSVSDSAKTRPNSEIDWA
jgi:hypothetical protein